MRLLFLVAASFAAQTTPIAPPAAPLPALALWASQSLDLPLAPGGVERWNELLVETLRAEPTLGLERALALSFAAAHGLPRAEASRLETFFQRGLTCSLPDKRVDALTRNQSGIYAHTQNGLFRKSGVDWDLVHPEVAKGYGLYDLDERTLLVGDGTTVYEVEDGRATPVIEGIRHFGALLRDGDEAYLGTGGGVSGAKGVYARAGGRWGKLKGSEALGSTGALAKVGGKLHVGAEGGVYRREGDAWVPVLWDQGPAHWIVEHEGVLYARTNRERIDGPDEWALHEIVDGKPSRILREEGSAYAIHVYGGRPVAEVQGGRAFERTAAGWRPMLDGFEYPTSKWLESGSEVYLESRQGVLKGDGRTFHKIHESAWIGEIAEHLGRRYLSTGLGLMRIAADRLVEVFPGMTVRGMISDGTMLLLGTQAGVQRYELPSNGLGDDWRESLLADLSARLSRMPEGGQGPVLEGDGAAILGRGRRSIFGELRLP